MGQQINPGNSGFFYAVTFRSAIFITINL